MVLSSALHAGAYAVVSCHSNPLILLDPRHWPPAHLHLPMNDFAVSLWPLDR